MHYTEVMTNTTSHPVRATALTIAYPTSGPHAHMAVIHRTGCAHTHRAGTSRELPAGWAPLADDYFHVAPCAR